MAVVPYTAAHKPGKLLGGQDKDSGLLVAHDSIKKMQFHSLYVLF